ncbi:MAG: hypothetical protein LKJ83_06975 [Eubacteriaceae bacterium]|jgi:acyl-CoA hydrolase|nr:hypothetical protein [Eubacteriaceae bacterium]
MDYEKIYKERLMTADEAIASVVRDGDRVHTAGHNAPAALLSALMKAIKAHDLKGIRILGEYKFPEMGLGDPELTADMVKNECMFLGAKEREYMKTGHVTTFVPMQLSLERRYNRDIAKPDVVFVETAPPDENGLCCTGPQGAGQLGDLWMFGKKIIAQINRNCPRVYGHPDIFIPVGKFDAIVEEDSDFHCIIPSVPGETDKKIAAHITPLIPDGATIQLGIGGMANAIGYALEDHRDLGVHTEMFVESMVYLQKKGIINNSKKTYLPGKSVAGFSYGTRELVDFVRENEELWFVPYSISNGYEHIIRNDNMISINSCVMMDITGECDASSLAGRQYSGTGGHLDYARGAAAANGGKSFIGFHSTLTDREGRLVSKIVFHLPDGVYVDTPRSNVQYVATEYGCVNLFGADIPDRCRKMISIAHPAFREKLEFEARRQGLIY